MLISVECWGPLSYVNTHTHTHKRKVYPFILFVPLKSTQYSVNSETSSQGPYLISRVIAKKHFDSLIRKIHDHTLNFNFFSNI